MWIPLQWKALKLGRNRMTENVGNIDRALRIILGLALLSLIFVGPKTWFGLIGLIPFITGVMRSCPLYTLFGINSCKVR